jgi:hypothetical protein
MISDSKGIRPDRPFLAYLPFGATHAPHQSPGDYLAKYRGRYDEGWDVVRDRWYRRQLELGVIPEGPGWRPATRASSRGTPCPRATRSGVEHGRAGGGRHPVDAAQAHHRSTGTAELAIDGAACGRCDLPVFMGIISAVGTSLGHDHGSAVPDRYAAPFSFSGALHEVEIQLSPRTRRDNIHSARTEMARQ